MDIHQVYADIWDPKTRKMMSFQAMRRARRAIKTADMASTEALEVAAAVVGLEVVVAGLLVVVAGLLVVVAGLLVVVAGLLVVEATTVGLTVLHWALVGTAQPLVV